jgi:hypothetical protein
MYVNVCVQYMTWPWCIAVCKHNPGRLVVLVLLNPPGVSLALLLGLLSPSPNPPCRSISPLFLLVPWPCILELDPPGRYLWLIGPRHHSPSRDIVSTAPRGHAKQRRKSPISFESLNLLALFPLLPRPPPNAVKSIIQATLSNSAASLSFSLRALFRTTDRRPSHLQRPGQASPFLGFHVLTSSGPAVLRRRPELNLTPPLPPTP